MKALRWHGRGDIRLDDVPEPRNAVGMSIVEVSLCGVCGSDVAEYQAGPVLIRADAHPLTGQAPPITLGHEFVGTVLETDAEGFVPGARVTADACWRCGRCSPCLAGNYHRCRQGGSIGLHSDGALARLVRVPDYALVAVPDALPDAAAAQTEPLAVALHALERGSLLPGDDVVVFGFGPIGAGATLIARALGARVLVVERSEPRLEVAERMGAEVLQSGDELPRRVRRVLGSGGADVVLDATGSPAALADAVECAGRGGRIVIAGLTMKSAALDASRLTLFERSLIGSLGYRGHLPRVLALVERGVVDPLPLVSELVSLGSAAHAISDLARDPGARIKVLIDIAGDGVPSLPRDMERANATN